MNTQEEKIISMMKRPIPKKKVSIIRLQMIKESSTLYGMNHFHGPEGAVNMVWPMIQYADREIMLVMSVDNKMLPLAIEIVAVGGLNVLSIDMKDLFKHAILNNAAGIVCFHNHPSGDPEVSWEDKKTTKKIQEAGRLLGIPLMDHIVIGENK